MSRKIRCVVIDDEPLARELIKNYVGKTPVLSLEGCFESGAEAIKTVMSGDIDLVFLDINMPMINGIEFAQVIPQRTRIIYITAYEQYALQGYKVNALDYLLKPVSYAEFMKAVGKAIEWFSMKDSYDASTTPSTTSPDLLTVKADSRLIQIRTDSINYVEVQNDRVVLNRKDGAPITALMSMKEIEEILPTDNFMRIHRSFIVNLSNIEIVERNRIVFGKTYIPIADSRREEFFARFTRR
ncbi:MAG: LytTR family DNA-binding domain-containing protein [Muribaculaceae bacterium]|nr:LytTR family DNA-binding domain-containing protein [Muribaculaceae bacterium]